MQAVPKVLKNVARILQVTDRLDVPFYLGSDEPLLGDPIDASFVSNFSPLMPPHTTLACMFMQATSSCNVFVRLRTGKPASLGCWHAC